MVQNVIYVTSVVRVRHVLPITLSGQQTKSYFRPLNGALKQTHVFHVVSVLKMADGPVESVVGKEPQSTDGKAPKEQVVDPWNVSAAEGEDKIDYDKLISQCTYIVMFSCNVSRGIVIANAHALMQRSLVVKGLHKMSWRGWRESQGGNRTTFWSGKSSFHTGEAQAAMTLADTVAQILTHSHMHAQGRIQGCFQGFQKLVRSPLTSICMYQSYNVYVSL